MHEPLDLDEIEEELHEIYAWPWGISKDGEGGWIIYHSGKNDESCDFACDLNTYHNDKDLWDKNLKSMEFASKSPERIAALVNRVRALEAIVKNAVELSKIILKI